MLAGGWDAWQAGRGDWDEGDACCPLKLQSLFEPQEPRWDLATDTEESLRLQQEASSVREAIESGCLSLVDDRVTPLLVEVIDDRFSDKGRDVETVGDVVRIRNHLNPSGCNEGIKRLTLSSIMQNMDEDAGWCLKPKVQLWEAFGNHLQESLCVSGDPSTISESRVRFVLFSEYQPEACLAALALTCLGVMSTVINPMDDHLFKHKLEIK